TWVTVVIVGSGFVIVPSLQSIVTCKAARALWMVKFRVTGSPVFVGLGPALMVTVGGITGTTVISNRARWNCSPFVALTRIKKCPTPEWMTRVALLVWSAWTLSVLLLGSETLSADGIHC